MASNTAAIRVGRLLEVRIDAGYRSVAEVDTLFDVIDRELAKLPPGTKHVTIADWRRCAMMAPEAAQRVAARIARVNDSTERSAVISSNDSPTAVMQFLRVIREAKLPDRKLFTSTTEVADWLSEVLNKDEAQRLRAFLNEPPGA